MPSAAAVNKRAKLFILSLLFLGPFFLAYYLYAEGYRFENLGQTARGQLIQPVIDFDHLALQNQHGQLLERPHRWVVMYVTQSCEHNCFDQLTALSKLHEALGKHQMRLEKWLVTKAPIHSNQLAEIEAAFTLAYQLRPTLKEGEAYILDPNGNLMMHYPPGFEVQDILKDLKKLFKHSTIG